MNDPSLQTAKNGRYVGITVLKHALRYDVHHRIGDRYLYGPLGPGFSMHAWTDNELIISRHIDGTAIIDDIALMICNKYEYRGVSAQSPRLFLYLHRYDRHRHLYIMHT